MTSHEVRRLTKGLFKTDKQVLDDHDDLEMMRRSNLWPSSPFLPVKRHKAMTPGDPPMTGLMVESEKNSVFLVNMFRLLDQPDLLDTCTRLQYTSLEALHADGWVVD